MADIVTQRLRLRRFLLDDIESLFEITSDPNVVRYIGSGEPPSFAETQYAVNRMVEHWQRHGYGRWVVEDNETGEMLGYGGLRNLDGVPELVYLLKKNAWGKGIATEIATACLEFGFSSFGFERVLGITKPENAGSRRVLEKVGMQFQHDSVLYGYDVVVYSCTKEQFATACPITIGDAGCQILDVGESKCQVSGAG
jgi:RimJ/RimL family protein N-acetyltransferase